MLMKVTDTNDVVTYVYEHSLPTTMNMIKFFNDKLGLKAGLSPDYEPMYVDLKFDYNANSTRSTYLTKEYKDFGNPAPKLTIVK